MAAVSVLGTGTMATLAEVLTSVGLRAVDAGALTPARELDALGFLQIALAGRQKVAWTGGFGLVG